MNHSEHTNIKQEKKQGKFMFFKKVTLAVSLIFFGATLTPINHANAGIFDTIRDGKDKIKKGVDGLKDKVQKTFDPITSLGMDELAKILSKKPKKQLCKKPAKSLNPNKGSFGSPGIDLSSIHTAAFVNLVCNKDEVYGGKDGLREEVEVTLGDNATQKSQKGLVLDGVNGAAGQNAKTLICTAHQKVSLKKFRAELIDACKRQGLL